MRPHVQIALLRAAGIPAGYSVVHVTKEAFAGPPDRMLKGHPAIALALALALAIP